MGALALYSILVACRFGLQMGWLQKGLHTVFRVAERACGVVVRQQRLKLKVGASGRKQNDSPQRIFLRIIGKDGFDLLSCKFVGLQPELTKGGE